MIVDLSMFNSNEKMRKFMYSIDKSKHLRFTDEYVEKTILF